METPRLDRDFGRRMDGAGRVFTRGQLEAELAAVEARNAQRASAFASSPATAEQELSPRFSSELARAEERHRRDVEQARRLGNE